MVINQGEIYWINLGEPSGSEPAYIRPFVVIQNNIFNKSLINTVIVCAVTSNMKRAQSPGNILLLSGEANLPKQSVVNISQIYTVDKRDLMERIGTLSPERIRQVIEGLDLILKPRDIA
ncbi:MAG: type II toxin-antitoxin system PemK/MazF family toxin [Actinobacteria bacterium]|nr:type II toxin-antitoxin system PemK/MazF family toxin [Actinomycetota bacterium]